MKRLISLVCKREGKKESISRAQVSEVLGVVSDILAREALRYKSDAYGMLIANGLRRLSKKKKK